jgi:hypothetical protein
MNNKKTFQRIAERIIPIGIALMYKDIIVQNIEIQKLQTMLLKSGSSNNKFMVLKEEAKKLSQASTHSYYDILKDLVNEEMSVLYSNINNKP